jgi:hypothetical protein
MMHHVLYKGKVGFGFGCEFAVLAKPVVCAKNTASRTNSTFIFLPTLNANAQKK